MDYVLSTITGNRRGVGGAGGWWGGGRGAAGKSYVLHRFFFSAAHDGSRLCALIRGFLFTPQKVKGTVCRQRWPFVAPFSFEVNFAPKKKSN